MRTRIIMIGLGLTIGVVIVAAWARLRTETLALANERENFARSDRALEREQAAFARRVVDMQLDVAKRKQVVLVIQGAADRARAKVGGYVARLKAEHAGRAPVMRPPDPPIAAGGGRSFPELMSDPEYSALYVRSTRLWLDANRGGTLRKLAVPEALIAKAIELLVEEQASSMDLHSIAGGNPLQPSNAKEIQQMRTRLAQETQAQLKVLLGDDVYRKCLAEIDDPRQFLTRPLERRLSYTEAPLTTEQIERIGAFEAAQATPENFRKVSQAELESRKTGVLPIDHAELAFYRSVLTPAQMDAVEELRREREAALKRELLPKYEEKKSAGAK